MHGPTIPGKEFPVCLRLRLGAHFLADPMLCPHCGKTILGKTCAHALCCAPAESTRGHYRVRDQVLDLCHLSDASALTEAPGLIPSAPALRPADILTRAAIPGGVAALDVGIVSPDACGSGADGCEAIRRRKLEDYRAHFAEMG